MPKIEVRDQGIEWGKKEMPEIKNALNTLNIWM